MEPKFSFRYSLPAKPGGPLVELSADEMERMLLQRLADERDNPRDALWQLARFHSSAKHPDQALDYLRQAMAHMDDPEAKAGAILAMGQAMEQVNDHARAIQFYREALSMEPCATQTWYFIHNNLGYCLNVLGKFEEGERYCRQAIEIDGARSNAYKNVGISRQGQGDFAGAARWFVEATRVDASDRRSLGLLKAMLTKHPELAYALTAHVECCEQAVAVAAMEAAKAKPVVYRGWRRRLFLLRLSVRHWLCRRRLL